MNQTDKEEIIRAIKETDYGCSFYVISFLMLCFLASILITVSEIRTRIKTETQKCVETK